MWSALGALGGAAVGSIGSLGQSAMSWYYSRKAAKLNYEYQEKLAKNQPAWRKAGLEKAGYNPILAVNGGAAGGSGTGLNVSAPQGGDPAGAGIAGAAGAAGIASAFAAKDKIKEETKTEQTKQKNIDADTALKKEQAELAKKQAELTGSQSAKNEWDVEFGSQYQSQLTNAQTEYYLKMAQAAGLAPKETSAKIDWLKSNASKSQAEIKGIYSNISVNKQKEISMSLENVVKSIVSAGYGDAAKSDPKFMEKAIAGEYGAKAKQSAKATADIIGSYVGMGTSIIDTIVGIINPFSKFGKGKSSGKSK